MKLREQLRKIFSNISSLSLQENMQQSDSNAGI